MSTKSLLLVVCLFYTMLLATASPLDYPSDANNPFLRRLRSSDDNPLCDYRGLKCVCNGQEKPTSCGLFYYNPRWNI